MTDHKATPELWHELERHSYSSQPWAPCILELRAKVEGLEDAAQKHIIETSANILALASRVEALEAVQRPASKVYEISKPLKLTSEQAQHARDLLAPNTKPTPNSSQIGRSLVERVGAAIFEQFENNAGNEGEARAAIREVAAWMREQHGGDLIAATVLEREAKR
jgi:t-SNARE complex subunit (syntaxin)